MRVVKQKMNKNIQKISNSTKDLTWYNISNLDEDALAYLQKNFKFHHLDLEDCKSEIQRPKIEEYPDYVFVILNFPIKSKNNISLKRDQIFFFVGKNYVITINDKNHEVNRLFEKVEKFKNHKKEYMQNGSGYLLYMIIDDLFESAFPIIDNMEAHLGRLEADVFAIDKNSDRLREILMLKKDIINFRRTIMPERSIIALLEHMNKDIFPSKLNIYFDDIVDKIERLWNNLENLQELVAALQETNESILSHNTNNVIKILTVFSVLILPLTFITGFYGMNVRGLPIAESENATIMVAIFLLFLVISMVAYFRYKKWI